MDRGSMHLVETR